MFPIPTHTHTLTQTNPTPIPTHIPTHTHKTRMAADGGVVGKNHAKNRRKKAKA